MNLSETLRLLADAVEQNETLKAHCKSLKTELEMLKSRAAADEKVWFSTDEAAEFLGVSASYLNKDRMIRDSQGRPKKPLISFSKHGERSVKYHRDDLMSYINRTKKKAA